MLYVTGVRITVGKLSMTGIHILVILLIVVICLQAAIIYLLSKQSRQEQLSTDELAEDALKDLYHLSREAPLVTRRQLARSGELPPGRLPVIIQELQRRAWAKEESGRLTITRAGEQRAVELIRAHRLWERYLADKEGLALDQLHAEAMRREHTTTPEEADRLAEEMGFPEFDPHGDPIPARGGELTHHAQGTPLSRWPIRKVGVVSHVEDEPPSLLSQLQLLGLTPGAQVEVDDITPGRILVWSGRQRLALTPTVAGQVYVEEAPAERTPLSEIFVGQAGRITAIGVTARPNQEWTAAGITPGAQIAAVRTDPLGDPVTYRLDGHEISLPRTQANQILLDSASIHEIPLPRRSFLVEGWEHLRELFVRYGSWTVIKRSLVFFGPAFVVSVGYMDPGNWGTDIEGGARFGYQLLWVILMSNLMAIVLQVLSAKLGIATGKSLPEVCRDHYPRWVSVVLWFTAELAAIATDLAEFLGASVGFYLLFHIPLFPAAILTGFVISGILLLERYGFRKVELVIIGLIAIIGFVYMAEIWLASPDWSAIARGLFVPTLPIGATLVAVGIIGATVMPHNLYLHSALILTRVRPSDSLARKHQVYRMAIVDAFIALNGAFFVNAAILTMSAAVFSGDRLAEYSLESAYQTLTPLLGPLAGIAFAVALLASGLSSSTTATLAGQVIMEGFLHHHMNVWLRRAITMIPSLIVIGLGIDPLRILVLSQVSLSFQLPFAMIPLVLFTSSPAVMGDFVNNRITKIAAWVIALIIIGLNVVLLAQLFGL